MAPSDDGPSLGELGRSMDRVEKAVTGLQAKFDDQLRALDGKFVSRELYDRDGLLMKAQFKALDDDVEHVAVAVKEMVQHRRDNWRLVVGQLVLPLVAAFTVGVLLALLASNGGKL